jgi:hypothetical protein
MGIYEKIAASIPKVTGLRCAVCGNVRRPRQSQIAGFFASGWPVCHGQTMHMHTESDPIPSPEKPEADHG